MQIWGYKSNSKRIKRIAKVILLAAIVTSVTAVFSNYVGRLLEITWAVDIAHVFTLIAYFAFFYSIEKYQFLTPSPNIAIGNIMESAREIIIITNAENKILSINRHSLSLLGYTNEEISKIDIHSIFILDKKC